MFTQKDFEEAIVKKLVNEAYKTYVRNSYSPEQADAICNAVDAGERTEHFAKMYSESPPCWHNTGISNRRICKCCRSNYAANRKHWLYQRGRFFMISVSSNEKKASLYIKSDTGTDAAV